MAQLAQTYIHVRPFNITQRKLDELGDGLQEIARYTAREVYGGNVTIDLKLEGGSLRVWVTVAGIINSIYIGYGIVADYKGFKEGIVELCNDAREFGTDVCTAFTQKARVANSQIYRTEKRLKAPGKIKRLIHKLEKLDRMGPTLSSAEMRRQLESIKHDLDLLQRDMEFEEIAQLKKSLEFKNLPPLEQLPERRQVSEMPKVALRVREVQPEMFQSRQALISNGTYLFFPEKPERLTYNKTFFIPPV